MSERDECHHGSLRRQCETCQAEERAEQAESDHNRLRRWLERLGREEDENRERAEQAEADANEQRLHYDKLFDEAVEIRKQRDQARQEAAKLREALKQCRTWARYPGEVRGIAREALHSSDAPASERKTLWTARATDYDPLPDVAE